MQAFLFTYLIKVHNYCFYLMNISMTNLQKTLPEALKDSSLNYNIISKETGISRASLSVLKSQSKCSPELFSKMLSSFNDYWATTLTIAYLKDELALLKPTPKDINISREGTLPDNPELTPILQKTLHTLTIAAQKFPETEKLLHMLAENFTEPTATDRPTRYTQPDGTVIDPASGEKIVPLKVAEEQSNYTTDHPITGKKAKVIIHETEEDQPA